MEKVAAITLIIVRTIEPLYDDLGKISDIKKFTIFNDDTFRHFFWPEHMKEEIIQTIISLSFHHWNLAKIDEFK